MKKLFLFTLIFALLTPLLAACSEPETIEPSATNLPSVPGTLYTAYVYVQYVDGEGFAGDGTFRDNVFVYYPDADKEFRINDTVRVDFYGENYKAESKTVKGYGTTVCAQVILKGETVRRSDGRSEPVYDKPILYLYPQTETRCSVRVDVDGKLTCTYPEHGENGWQDFTAKPDGTLTFDDGGTYYALYWEGTGLGAPDFSKGFCVKGSDTAAFLRQTLPALGLSAREANEFIIYWLPRMQDNAYNLISFQGKAYTDHAKLTISPAPDTLIRVFMAYKPLSAPVQIEAQTFETPQRTGFTAVEWGGSEIAP